VANFAILLTPARTEEADMVRLTRFGVVRTASVAAIVYLILSAIIFIPIALFASGTPMTITDQFGRTVTMQFPTLIFAFLPIFYAIFGWIFTAIACLIYNLAAWATGGIEFEAVPVAPRSAAPPPPVYQPPAAPPPAAPPATPTGTRPTPPAEAGAP
jgi:hypothetical protein